MYASFRVGTDSILVFACNRRRITTNTDVRRTIDPQVAWLWSTVHGVFSQSAGSGTSASGCVYILDTAVMIVLVIIFEVSTIAHRPSSTLSSSIA